MYDLAKVAMLASVSIKLEGLLGERRDRLASELVETTYSVEHRRAKATKYLIDRRNPKVKAVISTSQNIRTIVYRHSFPWGDTNMRMLPAKVFSEFKARLSTAVSDFESAIGEYVYNYPELVRESEQALGSLFDRSQYPDQDEIRKRFHVSISYWPMPNASHFVADIATNAADEARQMIESQTLAAVNVAANDLIGRVETSVSTFVDKLSGYQKTDTKVIGIFRDSLVSNVSDIASLITKLNFTDDTTLNNLSAHVSRLARYTADALRDNPDLRDTMVAEGKALLARLDAFRKNEAETDQAVAAMADYI